MSEWRMPASWFDGLCPILNCGVRLKEGEHYCPRHAWKPEPDLLAEEDR